MKTTNNNILLGISMGVAIISLAGFLTMSAAYYKKSEELAEAFKAEENAGEARINNTDDGPAIDPKDLEITEDDRIRGDKDAAITIIEFSDLECPYCQMFHDTMREVIAKNPDVRWVFKHFPLPSHPFARKAALAAEAAGEQGKFWEYVDALYADGDKISDDYFAVLAGELGLDTEKFNLSLASEKYAAKVDGDQALGKRAGVSGTPTSFANGQRIGGAYPYGDIKKIIDNLR